MSVCYFVSIIAFSCKFEENLKIDASCEGRSFISWHLFKINLFFFSGSIIIFTVIFSILATIPCKSVSGTLNVSAIVEFSFKIYFKHFFFQRRHEKLSPILYLLAMTSISSGIAIFAQNYVAVDLPSVMVEGLISTYLFIDIYSLKCKIRDEVKSENILSKNNALDALV